MWMSNDDCRSSCSGIEYWYCMRRGLLPPTKMRECPWKKLYIQVFSFSPRDEEDMIELFKNCSSEFKEYYIQMQATKRSQAPIPSQVKDDFLILDKTVVDQVSVWKSSRGLTDKVFTDHACSRESCTFTKSEMYFFVRRLGRFTEQQQTGGTDEAEPFMGSDRFARAYLLGYNCEDEKELEAALRFC